MDTWFFETFNEFNHGKFMVGRFDNTDWAERQQVGDGEGNPPEGRPLGLLRCRGWSREHMLVLDLQTGEGAVFAVRPSGLPRADLEKRRIWVCPMFESFLGWLYQQDVEAMDELPRVVELANAPLAAAGYRRPGPPEQ